MSTSIEHLRTKYAVAPPPGTPRSVDLADLAALLDVAEAAQAEAEAWRHVKSLEFGMKEGHDVFELIDAQKATRDALRKLPQGEPE